MPPTQHPRQGYDLCQRFIDEGIEPLWPKHAAWFECMDALATFMDNGLEPDKHGVNELIDLWHTENDHADNPMGFGLTTAPVIATYIRWSLNTKKSLAPSLFSPENSVGSHPYVISALKDYIMGLVDDGPKHYPWAKEAIVLLKQYTQLGSDIEQCLMHKIDTLFHSNVANKLTDIAKIYPYLDSPVPVPSNETYAFTQVLNDIWPLGPEDTTPLQNKSRWFKHVTRLEPIVAAWLSVHADENEQITALYNYVPLMDFTKADMYTAWMYIALHDFLEKGDFGFSDKYLDFKTFVSQTVSVIPEVTRKHWDDQLKYVSALSDNALDQAAIITAKGLRHDDKVIYSLPEQLCN